MKYGYIKAMIVRVLIFIVLYSCVSCEVLKWVTTPYEKLKRVSPDDHVTLHIMKSDPNFVNLLVVKGRLNNYHMGLRFEHHESKLQTLFDLWDYNGMFENFNPDITMDDNNEYNVNFTNGVSIRAFQANPKFHSSVHEYWGQHMGNNVSVISGHTYNAFIDWVSEYQKRKVLYKMFNLVKHWDRKNHSNNVYYKHGLVCIDVIWIFLNKLADLGVRFHVDTIKRDYVILYPLHPPKKVDMTDPIMRRDVAGFYRLFHPIKKNHSLWNDIGSLVRFLRGDAYLRYDDGVYHFHYDRWELVYEDASLYERVNDPSIYPLI
jgi:hypothetical protein